MKWSLQQTCFIPAFLPKALLMFFATGRSSDFPDSLDTFPSALGEQWFVVPGTHAAMATRDHSYGDSTGITPVSLLIVFINDEVRTNCDANI
jgi:hypothetical protein